MKEELTPDKLIFIGTCLVFYFITWYIVIKTKVLFLDKKIIQKAIDEGRTIKATLEPSSISTDSDYYRYRYVDLKGKSRTYVAKLLGGPADEITLYYNKKGRVFSEREPGRLMILWYFLMLIFPGILAVAVLYLFGFNFQ